MKAGLSATISSSYLNSFISFGGNAESVIVFSLKRSDFLDS